MENYLRWAVIILYSISILLTPKKIEQDTKLKEPVSVQFAVCSRLFSAFWGVVVIVLLWPGR